MRTIVVLGAYSAIVEATLRRFALDGDNFYLAGKDQKKLSIVADDLRSRGSSRVEIHPCDLSADDSPEAIFQGALKAFSSVSILYVGYGILSDSIDSLKVNFNSVVDHIEKWLPYFLEKKSGTIAVISSVAGDRGRKGNYVYGCAKGGLSIYLEGLRSKIIASGVDVITIKPGFVDTPMTSDFKKGALFVSADSAGDAIYRCILKGSGTYYVPWFWRIILGIIKLIPETILRKLPI